MVRTNRRAGESRDSEEPSRRLTRQATGALPPVRISEPQEQPPARRSRPAGDRKKKGKAKVVEESEGSDENPDLARIKEYMFAPRRIEEDRQRWIGTSSTFRPEEHWISREWYDQSLLEDDYLDTRSKQQRFRRMLDTGMSRMDAYTELERETAREKEPQDIGRHRSESCKEALRKNDLEGTCYPHLPTMETLGLRESVEALAGAAGLHRFLMTPEETYVDETIDFLDTVVIHLYDRRILTLQSLHGGGYITFYIRGQRYAVTLRQIQELFGFPEGSTLAPEIHRGELDRVWSYLTHAHRYATSDQKGSWIRNPAVSYFRRALAHTLYARDGIGNVNKSEMETLVRALRGILPDLELRGDENHASWACLLATQLMEYRDRAKRQANSTSRRKRKASVGGIASAIMRTAGVEFGRYRADYSGPNNIGPRFMDLRYLILAKVMVHEGGEYHYEFIHPERNSAFIRLPREEWTSLLGEDGARNAQFLPQLGDFQEDNIEEEPPEPEAAEPEAAEDEAAGPMTPRDRRGRTTSGRSDRRLNLLARMQKGMLKTMSKLVRSVSQNKKEIARLRAENETLRARHSMSHPPGTSAPSTRYSPMRYSFAGTEYYQGDEHHRGADEQEGQDDDPGSGDDQPH